MTCNEDTLSEPTTHMISSVIELIYTHLRKMKCGSQNQSLFFELTDNHEKKEKKILWLFLCLLFELLLNMYGKNISNLILF